MEGRGKGLVWDGGGLSGWLASPIAPRLSAPVSCCHHRPCLNEQRCHLHLCPTGEKISKLVHHLAHKSPSSPISWLINVGTRFARLQARDGTCRCLRAVRGAGGAPRPPPAHRCQLVSSPLFKTRPTSQVRWEGVMEGRAGVSLLPPIPF